MRSTSYNQNILQNFAYWLRKTQTTMIFIVFSWFHHENRLIGNFHYYIRNQRVKIRKYGKFYRNWKVHLFVTAPLMGFGSFFFKSHFSRKIMVLGKNFLEY